MASWIVGHQHTQSKTNISTHRCSLSLSLSLSSMIGYVSHYCNQLSHGPNLVLKDIPISLPLSLASMGLPHLMYCNMDVTKISTYLLSIERLKYWLLETLQYDSTLGMYMKLIVEECHNELQKVLLDIFAMSIKCSSINFRMLIRAWESIIGLILKLSHSNYGAMHLDALLPNIFSWVIFFLSFIKQLSLFSCIHQSIDQSFHFCATFIWSCTKSMNMWLFFSHLHMDKNKFVWGMSTMLNRSISCYQN